MNTNGAKRAADFVKVTVPGGCTSTHITTASSQSYMIEAEGADRIIWCSEADALVMVSNPLNLAWFEEPGNASLRTRVQEKQRGRRPPHWQGMTWSDLLQSIEDARPVNVTNKGGMTAQTLSMMRRTRW